MEHTEGMSSNLSPLGIYTDFVLIQIVPITFKQNHFDLISPHNILQNICAHVTLLPYNDNWILYFEIFVDYIAV